MKIEGMNGQTYSVGSAATTNTALGFGIAGTALGLMGGNRCGNGGLLGGILGGNNCGNDCCVSEREGALALALSEARSGELALQLARQEDAKIADVLKQTNDGLIQVANGVSRLDVKTACLEEKLNWIREESARNLAEAKSYTDHRVDCEARERQAADQNVLAYTNAELAKKISGELTINSSDINYHACTPVMQQCGCGSSQNPYYVGATDTMVTAITNAVLAAIKASQPA